ncbi:CidA/LrgA family protein [Paenibacillus thalictri]|uniref:CidA/LrgA family holin-like protein n=1 Tax=Paenibacillus thalictri TaxID=2527873 RepID=A0A4Q9DSG7_9BACL|nr:CidA/LrgA family holin-like protein [Paenibacillus thalictri]TBL79824.1 CidA/LrgA family holin-like protein [Paenibacillus thalictri]
MEVLKKGFAAAVQVIFIYALYVLLDAAVNALHVPVPASIIGLALLFVLLKLGILKLRWIEKGANWLIAEMLLFFIPAAAGIIQFKDLMLENGIGIVLVLMLSTLAVMVTGGMLAQRMDNRKERIER